jgi:serine protease Do
MHRALWSQAMTVTGLALAVTPQRAMAEAPEPDAPALERHAPSPALSTIFNPAQSLAPLVERTSISVGAIEVERGGNSEEDEWVPPFGVPWAPQRSGQGSGFIISADGLMLTNHHVVAHANEVRVLLADGNAVAVEVLGSDREMDVALLQLPSDRIWPHLAFADSDATRVGDWVLAMGNPLGLGMTVTAGIVSGKGRVLGHDMFGDEAYVQTDAAINPGNSGGPLLDLDGRVVGMNTSIIAGANAVGFAIPAKLLQGVIDDLRTHGHIVRAFLGMTSQPLTPELARAVGADVEQGALITSVVPDAPAAKAGLRRGDVVLEIDGEPVDNSTDLGAALGDRRPGDEVALGVMRGDQRKQVVVTLSERPREGTPHAQEAMGGDLGLTLVPLPVVADEEGVGVLVDAVDPKGPAGGVLRPGDIVLQVNRQTVHSPNDVVDGLARSSRVAILAVLRDDAQLFLMMPLF